MSTLSDLEYLKDKETREENYLANKLDALQATIDALETGFTPDPNIAELGATTNISASGVTLSTTDTYSDAAVKLAIDTAVDALAAKVESRLDAIESKLDTVIASLVNVGVVSA